MPDESYVTKDEFYKQIGDLSDRIHNVELNLTNRLTDLEAHFNDNLRTKIAEQAFKTRIIAVALGAGVSLLVTLLQRVIGF